MYTDTHTEGDKGKKQEIRKQNYKLVDSAYKQYWTSLYLYKVKLFHIFKAVKI